MCCLFESLLCEFRRGEEDPPPRDHLGEDIDNVLPTERAEGPFLDVEVAGASPGLRRLSATIDVLIAQDGVEGPERLADGAVLLDVQEVAGSSPHLTLGFLDEEGFGGAHQGGALLRRNDGDVAGDEGRIGGGGNDGIHGGGCLRV